ncbi:unnamed protein product, partial [Didymodactylos carnosus]
TIGGSCQSNNTCIVASTYGLECSGYTTTNQTCDCLSTAYWNTTTEQCTVKQLYNTSCATSYVCDESRGLQCQGLGNALYEKCDCYNATYVWDSLYVTKNQTCIVKKTNLQTGCSGDLECQDFNYLVCSTNTSTNTSVCQCVYTDYWDGSRCQAKLNYTQPCTNTTMCRDFYPVLLQCRSGQCLCESLPTYYYWSDCLQNCITAKQVS